MLEITDRRRTIVFIHEMIKDAPLDVGADVTRGRASRCAWETSLAQGGSAIPLAWNWPPATPFVSAIDAVYPWRRAEGPRAEKAVAKWR